MAKRRGGGMFRNTDPITGAVTTNWKNIFVLILGIVVLGVIIGVSIYLGTRDKDDDKKEEGGGGAVAPPYSKMPGRITIAEVTQAPSAGQAVIYFSQAQAQGTVCDTCTALFDVNITYSGGQYPPPPVSRQVTAPSTSGVVTFDYSVPAQTGGSTLPQPANPTSVRLEITGRSVSSQDPTKKSGPTSFKKTLPYVA